MEVEINNLSEPVEPVPLDELSIARYVETVAETEDEDAEPETNWLADKRKVDQFITAMEIWLEKRQARC